MITRETVERLLSATGSLQIPEPNADLLELLDSLSFVEFLFGLEQECDMDLMTGDVDFENFRTVEQIVEFVNALPAIDVSVDQPDPRPPTPYDPPHASDSRKLVTRVPVTDPGFGNSPGRRIDL